MEYKSAFLPGESITTSTFVQTFAMPSTTEQVTDATSSRRLSQASTAVGSAVETFFYSPSDDEDAVQGNPTSATTRSIGDEGHRPDRPPYRSMAPYTGAESNAQTSSRDTNTSTQGQSDRTDSGIPSNISPKAWKLLGMGSSNDGSAATSAAGPSTAGPSTAGPSTAGPSRELAAKVPDKARAFFGLDSDNSRRR